MTTPTAPAPSQQPPAGPVRGQGMRRTGKWMSIIGALLLVGCVIAAIIMTVTGAGRYASEVMDHQQPLAADQQVQMSADETRLIFASEQVNSTSCTVEAADGSGLRATAGPVGDDTPSQGVEKDGKTWYPVAMVEATDAGTYTISCATDPAADLLITDSITDHLGGVGLILGAMAVGFLGGGLGFVLLVVGLILYFVGRSRVRRATVRPAY